MNQVNSIQTEAIRALAKEIPLNDFGMPTGIYRTDLLPFDNYKPKTTLINLPAPMVELDVEDEVGVGVDYVYPDLLDDGAECSEALPLQPDTQPREAYRIAGFLSSDLSQAFMPLQFEEGFPAFETGLPFWSRLEFEPYDAYVAFQRYTQMNRGKNATNDPEDPQEEYDGIAASGLRSISTLAADLYSNDQDMLLASQKYQEYYHLYYWGMRAQAYDLYRVAQHRKQQELRAVETLDDHYVMSRRLRHRLMTYIESEEEFWELMTPKVGMDMLKTLTQLERISAGVPAAGPMSDADRERGGTPFEIHLKNVAQTNRAAVGNTINEEGEVLDKALEDPEALEVLQELIIKAGV